MTEAQRGEDPFAEILASLPWAAKQAWEAYARLLKSPPAEGAESRVFKDWIAACRPGLAQVEMLMRLSARRAAGGSGEGGGGPDLDALYAETRRDLAAFLSENPPEEV